VIRVKPALTHLIRIRASVTTIASSVRSASTRSQRASRSSAIGGATDRRGRDDRPIAATHAATLAPTPSANRAPPSAGEPKAAASDSAAVSPANAASAPAGTSRRRHRPRIAAQASHPAMIAAAAIRVVSKALNVGAFRVGAWASVRAAPRKFVLKHGLMVGNPDPPSGGGLRSRYTPRWGRVAIRTCEQ
jgi:hypothetical protein